MAKCPAEAQALAEPFCTLIRSLQCIHTLRFSIYNDAVKARFSIETTEFVADYEFKHNSSIYVSVYKGSTLVFKECTFMTLQDTLNNLLEESI
jgi:hypothetical protein